MLYINVKCMNSSTAYYMFQSSSIIFVIAVQNLISKWTCVEVYILQFVRPHISHNCHNVGLLHNFYSL